MKTTISRYFKTLFFISLVLILFGCEKNDDLNASDVTGTYIGTLTSDLVLTQTATTVVSITGDHIEVYCYSENFEETITLDVYNDTDRIMVCLTGDDFDNLYGHMLDEEHMNHNNINWMQHLNNEHQEGDEHFGFFNMQNQSFEFIFRMSNGDFLFKGEKQII